MHLASHTLLEVPQDSLSRAIDKMRLPAAEDEGGTARAGAGRGVREAGEGRRGHEGGMGVNSGTLTGGGGAAGGTGGVSAAGGMGWDGGRVLGTLSKGAAVNVLDQNYAQVGVGLQP